MSVTLPTPIQGERTSQPLAVPPLRPPFTAHVSSPALLCRLSSSVVALQKAPRWAPSCSGPVLGAFSSTRQTNPPPPEKGVSCQDNRRRAKTRVISGLSWSPSRVRVRWSGLGNLSRSARVFSLQSGVPSFHAAVPSRGLWTRVQPASLQRETCWAGQWSASWHPTFFLEKLREWEAVCRAPSTV